jgi:hypothetical protein
MLYDVYAIGSYEARSRLLPLLANPTSSYFYSFRYTGLACEVTGPLAFDYFWWWYRKDVVY